MYKFLLFACLSLAIFSTNAAKIINNEHLTKETDCFTGIFADYDSWHQFIAQKGQSPLSNKLANKVFKAYYESKGKILNKFYLDKIIIKQDVMVSIF